jgi:hypothetical protein
VWIVLCSLVFVVGCGSGRPDTAPVRGQVTYKGEPVAGASVVFLCPGAPRMAIGRTDASGNYQLTTYEPNDGAAIGMHTVTVKKYDRQAAAPKAAVDPNDPKAIAKGISETMRQSALAVAKSEKSGSLLPEKYASIKTSDLQKEVVDGENVINIELVD